MPGPKADGYWLLARNLKDRGSPVTTIGFQAHLGLEDRLDEAAMRDNLKRFADMGYNIEITEMDVVARNPRTSRAHADEREAQLMSQVVAACVAAAGPRCVGVTAWGLTDALHHKVRGVAGSHETPTLFDEDVRPKPAYAAVAQAISKARPTL
jgi:endo-1,4-beta-xylanase